MSVDTMVAALNFSEAQGTDRNVMLVLAEAADPKYGITWLSLEPPKWEKADPRKCITHRARCSKREAIRAIKALEAAGEIQVRKAQRGQRRISVYKVCIGEYADVEVNYDDLPFVLKEPFETANTRSNEDSTGCQIVTPSLRTVVTPRGDQAGTSRGDSSSPDEVTALRARVPEPSFEPAAEPPSETPSQALPVARPAARGTVEHQVPAAASETEPVSLERAVQSLALLNGWDSGSLGVVAPLLQQVPADVFTRTLQTTLDRRGRNPVGLFVHLLQTSIDTWRRDQHQAQLDRWDALFGEAGIERVKREEPERYVLAWATPQLDTIRPLPAAAVVGHVFDYVHEYVDDEQERARLLELFVATAERAPDVVSVRDWTLFALDRDGRDLDDVEKTIRLALPEPLQQEAALAFARDVHANVVAARASNERRDVA